MKKIIYLTAALLLILTSCSPKNDELVIPDNVVPKDKMTDILVEIQIVEGALIYKRSTGQIYNDFRDYYYTFIFDKYDVSQKKFDRSMDFYKENLEVLDKIYEEVLKRLETKKRKVDNS